MKKKFIETKIKQFHGIFISQKRMYVLKTQRDYNTNKEKYDKQYIYTRVQTKYLTQMYSVSGSLFQLKENVLFYFSFLIISAVFPYKSHPQLFFRIYKKKKLIYDQIYNLKAIFFAVLFFYYCLKMPFLSSLFMSLKTE